jgi:hypothetical protein
LKKLPPDDEVTPVIKERINEAKSLRETKKAPKP